MKKSQRRTIVTLSALAATLAGLGVASQVIGAVGGIGEIVKATFDGKKV